MQAAVDAVADRGTVHVCAGNYAGQVVATKAVNIVGQAGVQLTLPTTVANGTTSCDNAISSSYQRNQSLVTVCGNVAVSLVDVELHAAWPGNTCYGSLYALFIGGGANVRFANSSVTAAGAVPLNGCQGGVGIQVGSARATPNLVGTLTMANSSVSGYQKGGITVSGAGSSATIATSTVTGIGPQTQIAQNGIQISGGAKAVLQANTITGNECDHAVCGSNGLSDTQSAGILLWNNVVGTVVSSNNVSGNDMGLYASSDTTAVSSPTAIITGNTFANNRYEGLQVDQGNVQLSGNTYRGGRVGAQQRQAQDQTYGTNTSLNGETFSGQSVAAFQVISDANSSDPAGAAILRGCRLGGGAILNNSTNVTLTQQGSTP